MMLAPGQLGRIGRLGLAPAKGASGPVAVLVDEWNALDKEAAVMLPDPYTMTIAENSGGDEMARGTYSVTTGLRYVEFEVTKADNFGGDTLGIGVAGAGQSFDGYLGDSNNGIGFWTSGNVYLNNATAVTLAGLAGNVAVTRYAMALDLSNKLVRFANITRATGLLPAEGIDISALPAELFICGDLEKAGHSIRQVTDPGLYLGAVPEGYTYWRSP